MNLHQTIKLQAREMIARPYGNGRAFTFELAEAQGYSAHTKFRADGTWESKSATPETFRLAAIGIARAKALVIRHRRFRDYMVETRHKWADDAGTLSNWADNSKTVQQVSALTGERRTRWIDTPHGDVC